MVSKLWPDWGNLSGAGGLDLGVGVTASVYGFRTSMEMNYKLSLNIKILSVCLIWTVILQLAIQIRRVWDMVDCGIVMSIFDKCPHSSMAQRAQRIAKACSFYLTSKTWSSGPGQSSMALPVNMLSGVGVLEEEKFQLTNIKCQTNNNDRNSKFQTCFGHLVLEFEICL